MFALSQATTAPTRGSSFPTFGHGGRSERVAGEADPGAVDEAAQEALAERAGIHRTYVSSVERAERNVSIDNICRLAHAVGVEPQELLTPVPRQATRV